MPLKQHSKPLVTGSKEMEIQGFPNKEFKIIYQKMLNEPKQNTDKQFTNIRRV